MRWYEGTIEVVEIVVLHLRKVGGVGWHTLSLLSLLLLRTVGFISGENLVQKQVCLLETPNVSLAYPCILIIGSLHTSKSDVI